jgi:hypothetical protein
VPSSVFRRANDLCALQQEQLAFFGRFCKAPSSVFRRASDFCEFQQEHHFLPFGQLNRRRRRRREDLYRFPKARQQICNVIPTLHICRQASTYIGQEELVSRIALIIPQSGWLLCKHSSMFKLFFDPRIKIFMPNTLINMFQKCH